MTPCIKNKHQKDKINKIIIIAPFNDGYFIFRKNFLEKFEVVKINYC